MYTQRLESITCFINIKIGLLRYLLLRNKVAKETDVVDIHTMFGLLYMAGVMRVCHMNIDDFQCCQTCGFLRKPANFENFPPKSADFLRIFDSLSKFFWTFLLNCLHVPGWQGGKQTRSLLEKITKFTYLLIYQ